MKLNYSSLQHPVGSIERPVDDEAAAGLGMGIPVLAIGLHGHLAPAAWALAERARVEGRPAPAVGYVQTGGGALPGGFSRDVKTLLDRGLIAGHITAGPSYGGQAEAITLIGAFDAAESQAWDAVISGPGPGILGSATVYGHGGMSALDVAHAGLALGATVVLSPRLSGGDRRPRHRGLSHHSRSVLKLLLAEVNVPLPTGRHDLAGAIKEIGGGKHRVTFEDVDIDGYANSGLPRRTMGRDIEEDPEFFSGPLAAGSRVAELTLP